jgi:hypothetical protein
MIVSEYRSVSMASTNILSILMKSTPSLSLYDSPLWPVPSSPLRIACASAARGSSPERRAPNDQCEDQCGATAGPGGRKHHRVAMTGKQACAARCAPLRRARPQAPIRSGSRPYS